MTSNQAIPEVLSDKDARAIIEQNKDRANAINQKIYQNNARAEQGEKSLAALNARAMDMFGTCDPVEMAKIRDERMAQNAANVKAWLASIDEGEKKIEQINRSATAKP